MAKRNGADPRQRQLGSIEAEVVNGLLPAGRLDVMPTSVAEFDGWNATDVRKWLNSLTSGFRQLRAVVGLGLWVLRDRTAGEAAYMEAVEELAAAYGVDPGTLWRWRNAAQQELGLPDPKGAAGRIRASKAALARREKERPPEAIGRETRPMSDADGSEIGDVSRPNGDAAKQAPKAALVASERDQRDATTAEVVARDDTRQAEVQPPAAQANGPGATGTTVSPRAPGSSSARGAEPPAPPTTAEPLAVTVEWLAGQLAARKPTEARAMSVATFAKLESWVQQARAVRPQPATGPIARRREDTNPGAAKCLHPVTRRIGDRCGACGAATKAK